MSCRIFLVDDKKLFLLQGANGAPGGKAAAAEGAKSTGKKAAVKAKQ